MAVHPFLKRQLKTSHAKGSIVESQGTQKEGRKKKEEIRREGGFTTTSNNPPISAHGLQFQTPNSQKKISLQHNNSPSRAKSKRNKCLPEFSLPALDIHKKPHQPISSTAYKIHQPCSKEKGREGGPKRRN